MSMVYYMGDRFEVYFFRPQKHGSNILEGKIVANSKRTKVTLACTECKQRNYDITKDKKTHPDRMETKKYCRFCQRHTMHRETK